MPESPKEEEKDAPRNIVEVEPQRIAVPEEPVAYPRERQHQPVQLQPERAVVRYRYGERWCLADEVHGNVCREERHEEPRRTVSVPRARCPEVLKVHTLCKPVARLQQDEGKEHIHGAAHHTPEQVWQHEALCLSDDEGLGVARDGLVEIARLEEEEAHEVVAPAEHFLPPWRLVEPTLDGDVQHYHPEDADAAQQVECMVALLLRYFLVFTHMCKVTAFS